MQKGQEVSTCYNKTVTTFLEFLGQVSMLTNGSSNDNGC